MRAILGVIGTAGILLVGVAAPNLFKVLPDLYRKRFSKKSIDQSIERLKNRGWLKFVQGRNGWRLELTERGYIEFMKYETQEKLIKRSKNWDGKWHLLIFDIREDRKSIREKVRRSLVALGFYRLQDSVWIYPYPCEDILEMLRTQYRVRHDALYICAQKIAKDKWLRKHFNLSLD